MNPSSVIWPWSRPPEADRAAARARRRSVRVHGAVQALIGAAVGFLVYWQLSRVVGIVAWSLAGVVGCLAWVSPDRAYPVLRRGIQVVAHAVGRVLTVVLMAPIYFLFFTPFHVLWRSGPRDRLKRTCPAADVDSFWVARPETRPAQDSYRRQF